MRAQGVPFNPITKQRYDLKGGESIRLTLLSDRILVAVTTGPWSDNLCLALLNVLMTFSNQLERSGTAPRFLLVGPTPLPAAVRFIFAHTARGRFERLAMGFSELWNSSVPVDPTQTEALTPLAAQLVEHCFNLPLQGTLADAPLLNELVLQQLRFPISPEAPLPSDAYIPASSLLMVGLLVGRAIWSSAHSPCSWEASPDSAFGLTLSTYIRSISNRGQANVIDKVFKLYLNGAEDAVDFLAKHVVDESKP